MDSGTLIKRKTIPITFSKELEYMLLNLPTQHISLTHDLEICAYKGIELLEELEDVQDIKHRPQIKRLIDEANHYLLMSGDEFKTWHLSISEDLLDEIELLIMTHGDDLKELGLKASVESIFVMLVVTGKYHEDLKYESLTPMKQSPPRTRESSLES